MVLDLFGEIDGVFICFINFGEIVDVFLWMFVYFYSVIQCMFGISGQLEGDCV